MAGTTIATATQENKPLSIGQVIQQLRPEIQRALPKHMDGDRMARLALTVLRRDPNLARCTPESFAGALLTAAALGLEPGVSGEAYLVPYKGECTLIVGYQGYAKLFWQHPLAKHLECRAVYENDEFDYAYGLAPFLTHKPARDHTGKKVTDYYAVATLSSGGSAFVVLSPDEVRQLRGGKVGPSGKIADPMLWMERKTVLRQLVKMLPRSTSLNHALDVDERNGADLAAHKVPQSIADGGAVIAIEDGQAVNTETGEVVEADFIDAGEPDQATLDEIAAGR